LGVAGAIVPLLPGAPLSLVGVYVFWWNSGYQEPGLVVLFVLTLIGIGTALLDYFSSAISAKASGASTKTTLIASVVGFVLIFVMGPVGILVGVASVVFISEYHKTGDQRESLKTGLFTAAGMLASTFVQVLLTFSMFLTFVFFVFVL
jgi:hypothetical protein